MLAAANGNISPFCPSWFLDRVINFCLPRQSATTDLYVSPLLYIAGLQKEVLLFVSAPRWLVHPQLLQGRKELQGNQRIHLP